MNAIRDTNSPLLAVGCLLDGLKLLTRAELRQYLLIPLLINTVLYTGAFILGYHSVSALIHQAIPDWLSWLSWILWPLFFISFLLIGFFTFTLVANLIAAPYYSRLAAKTLSLLHGHAPVAADAGWDRVFFGELKRIGYLLLRVLPLLVLFLIPVVNLIAPVLWAAFAAWGIAMEFIAYPLEMRGQTFDAQKRFMQQRRWSMLSFGALTGLGLTLPIVNLVMGQTAVIAATVYVDRVLPPAGGDEAS